jgi:hypothetical protein
MALGDKMFPRVIREKCHPSIATSCCAGRRQAVRSGEFYWHLNLGGWVDRSLPVRSMKDWETIYKAGTDTRGTPYLLDLCPWCSCELPTLFKKRHVDCDDAD